MSKENNRYREEEASQENTEIKEELVEDINSVNKETEQDELTKVTNSYLRVLADFENYKKRTNEERIKERKYMYFSLFEEMISVVDIFDKAVNTKTEDDKLNNYLFGFRMINDNLKQILEKEGIKKINTQNAKFDPNYHHAIETDWDETKEENIILQEMQTGYMYKDRLLRASLVKVNQKKEGNEKNE